MITASLVPSVPVRGYYDIIDYIPCKLLILSKRVLEQRLGRFGKYREAVQIPLHLKLQQAAYQHFGSFQVNIAFKCKFSWSPIL